MGLLSTESALWLALSRAALWLAPRNLMVLCPPIEGAEGIFIVPVGTLDGIKKHLASSKCEAEELYRSLLASAHTSVSAPMIELHVVEGCKSFSAFEEAVSVIREPRRV